MTVLPTLLTDPGTIYHAPLGSTLPTNTVVGGVFTDTWPVAWIDLGATLSGADFTYNIQTSPVYVAEFLDPIKVAVVSRTTSLAFALTNATATNLKKILNGATTTVTGTTGTTLTKVTPPVPGSETRAMIGWQSLDATVRMIGYQCINTGAIKLSFNKAPAYTDMPCVFDFEVPVGGNPVDFWTAGTARA